MKNFLLILSLLCLNNIVFSQAPSHFKYQGVAKNADNQAYENADLGFKISIIEDNGSGTGSGQVRYVEKHLVATSPLGIFSLNIGDGLSVFGEIEDVNWSQGSFWLKVEMDVEGGENYIFMGNSPILPVPLAMHAMTVEDKNDADADPENELQTLVFNANTNMLSLTNGGQVDLSTLQGGNGGTDDQTLQLNGNFLSIEGGNQVDLSPLQVEGSDDQTLQLNGNILSIEGANQIDLSSLQIAGSDNQNLQLIGTTLFIEDGNQINLAVIQDGTEDADANPTNELQTISFNPNTNELSISEGNTIAIPAGQADADADPENELQTLNFDENTNTLSLSDGGEVDLSALEGGAGSDEQTLTLNGTILAIENGNNVDLGIIQDGTEDADADPNNEIQNLQLNGTTLSIENGNQVNLALIQDGTEDADANPENELQTISFNVNTNELSISEGNTIAIPAGQADADADPENELQTLSFDENTNTLSLTDGGEVDLSALGGGVGSDEQTLSLNGTILAIENGNNVDLSIIQDGTQDADADPQNELQNLQLNGTTLSIDNGNQVNLNVLQDGTEDADADPQNELQNLQLNGTTLSIEGGNQVNLNVLQDGTQDADADPNNELQNLQLNGTMLSIDNGNQVNLNVLQDGTEDADADPNNEIQTIAFDANTNQLSILGGNSINIPLDVDDNDHSPTNELQILSLNGSTLSLDNGGGQIDLSGIGGSPLWSQSPGQVYTNDDVGVGLESDHFATLEVKEDLLIRNAAGNTSAYMFSTNEGGHLLLKKGNQNGITGTGLLDLASMANGGAMFLRNNNGNIRGEFQINAAAGGNINLLNSLNNNTIRMNAATTSATIDMRQPNGTNGTYLFANDGGGYASFYGASPGIIAVATIGRNGSSTSTGSVKVGTTSNTGLTHMYVTGADEGGNRSGIVDGFSTEGGRVFRLSSYSDSRTRGVMAIYNDDGDPVAYVTGQDGGEFILQESSTNRNVYLGTSANGSTAGKISVYDPFNDESAGFFTDGFGNGTVWADIKNFRMDHPKDDTKEIWYASVEGSEAAAYQRGTGNLVNGEAIVTFPEHFQLVANYKTMTVLLTPLSADCNGLAVIEKTATGFKVKELLGGSGTYQFDWEVKCVRKGYENYKTIREKKDRL